jgi:hypothetical protein
MRERSIGAPLLAPILGKSSFWWLGLENLDGWLRSRYQENYPKEDEKVYFSSAEKICCTTK